MIQKNLLPLSYSKLKPKKKMSDLKEQIDKMSYEQLLARWRFAPSGDSMFVGEIGKYYAEVMSRKKNELSHEEQVQTSKDLGWSK